MKPIKTGVSLALVIAGLAAVPALQAQAAAPAARTGGDQTLVQRMRAEASDGARLALERSTGKVGFVRAAGHGDLMPSQSARSAPDAAAKATAYLAKYAPAFGAPAAQLREAGVTSTRYGWTVRFEQTYRGIPVFGSRLLANVDKAGDLTSVNGFVAPALDLGVSPRVTRAQAESRALSVVRADPPTGSKDAAADVAGLTATATLSIYRMGAIKGEKGANVLAWVVEVTNHANVRDMVFLDAATGKVVNRYSMMDTALERHLIEAAGSTDPDTFTEVWTEGDPFPGGLDEAQQELVLSTGDSYWFFKDTFGRDSYDGAGHPMTTVNNDGRIACPNANWNGTTTNYCDGVTSDDTVAHEWAHAYTEYTSGLIYQWQPGAMNEAFSDIWGETVDMANDRQNDVPDTVRPEGQCSKYTRGEVGVTINAPADIAGPCESAPAQFGPVFDKTGVTTDVVVGQDAAEEGGGSTTDGCSPFSNAAALAGLFVYVDRGSCPFAVKAGNAEDAGATGIIIGNNVSDPPFSPSGSADIYGVMIDQASGAKIKGATGTVNVTIKDIDDAPKADSYRWLSSENDPAFGGAIRDMWNPNCYDDPGKVTDAQYWCSTDDSGGVHSNSGVVNHTYALLVDGSTSNGVEVTGLGLDKAANVFWRAQTAYLTPTSDFADLADALTASCTDLVGQPINKVQVVADGTPQAADPITAQDCAAVQAVTEATELRTPPTQCNFKPMLAKNAPALCGKRFRTRTFWKDDFEKGLGRWKATETVVYAGGHGYKWRGTRNVPGRHDSKVAFGPAPDEGDCSAGAGDISSVNGITTPRIAMPGGGVRKLSFQHYMATEPGYDGGNVKISVNGKAFKVIPTAAYLYNGPKTTLATEADGNTNPLAGQVGFTGTDGGIAFGSWGTSIIDLRKAGARVGDRVRVRIELGRDGCGGNDGWYVDNVRFVICKKRTHHRAAATLGRSSTEG